jgi:putative tryptophan/tyrosine transport system substrate-binding protein
MATSSSTRRLAGTAAWPMVARAQQTKVPVVGILNPGSVETGSGFSAAVLSGLAEAGYIEGRNFAVEHRSAEGRYDRLSALAADLATRNVAVIVTVGGVNAALAAKMATTTIPVVFATGVNPVEFGLVASLNRPGGNLTGITDLSLELSAKRLEVLHELVPAVTSIAVFVNPTNPVTEAITTQLHRAAQLLNVRLVVLGVRSRSDFGKAFATLVEQRAGALMSAADPVFRNQLDPFIALAAEYGLPAMYPYPWATRLGGLIGYGADDFAALRLVGVYAGRILKGEKPADLPVQQSTKVELGINLKTAKALGLTIPEALLATADEVIQ